MMISPQKQARRFSPILGSLLLVLILLMACTSAETTEDTTAPDAAEPVAATTEEAAPPETETEESSIAATEEATPLPATEVAPTTEAPEDAEILAEPTAEPTPVTLRDDTDFGPITFAVDVSEEMEPIEPNLIFPKGIAEIHAVFEYEGMDSAYEWERVWYLNDQEVARSRSPWTEGESGIFDYTIDNNDRALPPGDWVLELYVQDELMALGVFVIDETETAQAAPTPSAYKLAYTKCAGDQHDIYVSDTNGSTPRLLVNRGAGPSWSPDGSLVFFYGEGGVDRQTRDGLQYVFDGISNGIVAVRAEPFPTGINQLRIFQNLEWKQGTARSASVSPNGSMVAYDAKPGNDYRVYFLGTEANQQFRFEIVGEQADWSPDSERIVYRSGRDGSTGIWISNRDDSGHTQITFDGSDSFPTWSADGSKIAFSRNVNGTTDIFTVNPDGTGLQQLTTTEGHDTLPTFAPNGDIIFRSARNGSWSIWKMNSDGSEQMMIIEDACVGNDWAHSRMDVAP